MDVKWGLNVSMGKVNSQWKWITREGVRLTKMDRIRNDETRRTGTEKGNNRKI
jgi:hypothetical protein